MIYTTCIYFIYCLSITTLNWTCYHINNVLYFCSSACYVDVMISLKLPLRIFPECNPGLTPAPLGWFPTTPFDPECKRMDEWMDGWGKCFHIFLSKETKDRTTVIWSQGDRTKSSFFFWGGGAVMHKKLPTLLVLCSLCASCLFISTCTVARGSLAPTRLSWVFEVFLTSEQLRVCCVQGWTHWVWGSGPLLLLLSALWEMVDRWAIISLPEGPAWLEQVREEEREREGASHAAGPSTFLSKHVHVHVHTCTCIRPAFQTSDRHFWLNNQCQLWGRALVRKPLTSYFESGLQVDEV